MSHILLKSEVGVSVKNQSLYILEMKQNSDIDTTLAKTIVSVLWGNFIFAPPSALTFLFLAMYKLSIILEAYTASTGLSA